MQITIFRFLRALLIGLIALISLAVLVNYSQTARRRRAAVKPITQILSPEMLRSANNIEYFANSQGGTKFRLQALKLLENRQGKELLEGVTANDFDSEGNEVNHITSEWLEYDTIGKQLFFYGKVRLHPGKGVELRMQTLHYNLKDQIGYSDDRFQLVSTQADGTARGVRYDNARKRMELLHEVAFVVHRSAPAADGSAQNQDYRLFSQQGTYSETEHTVRLNGAARIVSATGTLAGDRITATFTPEGKQLTGLVCDGNSVYESVYGTESRKLLGERIELGINQASRTLEKILVHEHASFSSNSADGEQKLDASEIQLELDPVKGTPRTIRSQAGIRFTVARGGQSTVLTGDWMEANFAAEGGALEDMHLRDHASMIMNNASGRPDELQAQDIHLTFSNSEGRSVPRELQAQGSIQWKSRSGGPPGGAAGSSDRSLNASSLHLTYSQNGDFLESGTAENNVVLSALPSATATTGLDQRLQCDRLSFDFYPGNNRLRRLIGEGDVRVFYRKPAGSGGHSSFEEFHTSSSSIQAQFRESDGSAESVNQSGNFVYQDATRTAKAGTCDYDATTDMVDLRNHPSVADSDSATSGDVIRYARNQGLLTVQDHVRSILMSTRDHTSGFLTTSSSSSSPCVVSANEMQYWTNGNAVTYTGHVQLLSATGQFQADSLTLLDSGQRVEGKGNVRHLLSGTAMTNSDKRPRENGTSAAKTDDKAKVVKQTLIRSARFQYNRAENRMHYEDNVTLDSPDAKAKADSLDAFLDADGTKLERATAQGNVLITQPGREVKGATAEYLLSEGKVVVTGNPATGSLAELRDYVKGTSTALRLTFFTADDRIVLENRK
jgi:LPS export ABC transporter protein LptC